MTLYEKLALCISALAAVATLCAVLVALYNAKLPYRKRLKIINRESTEDMSTYELYRTGVDDADIVIINRSNGIYKIQGIDFIYRNSRIKVSEICTESEIQTLPYKMKPYEAIGIDSVGLAMSPLFIAELYAKSIESANHAQSLKTDLGKTIGNILDRRKPKFEINTPYEKKVKFSGSLSINKYRSAYLLAPDTAVNAYDIIKHTCAMKNGDSKFVVFWNKYIEAFSYKSEYLAGEVVKALKKSGKKEERFIPSNRSILYLKKENDTVKAESWSIPEQKDFDAIFTMMQKTSDLTEK